MAVHFCDIDYDRTLAIVVEIYEGGVPRWIGVARLVANANHRNSEYAMLIEDTWQGRGLGSKLTKYCLEIGHTWDINEVVAETTADNFLMQRIFSKLGFVLESIAGIELLYRKSIAS